VTNASTDSAAKKNDVIIAATICAISLVFLAPCFMMKELVDFYGELFDMALASTIPEVLGRYQTWLMLATVTLVLSHRKLFDATGKTRLLQIAVFTILLDALVCIRELQFPYCLDDTYIVFRYVNNIINFGCAHFDVGTPVHAISSQMHLWILVAARLLTGSTNLAILSQSINLGFEIGSLFILFFLLKRLFAGTWIAIYGCAVHVLWVYNFLGVCHGKESSETIFFLLLFLYGASSQRERLQTWSASLASLCRPEGMLLFITDAIDVVRRNAEKPIGALKNLALPLVLILVAYLAIFLYYGTILPQGMLLKAKIYNIEPLTTVSMIVYLLTSSFLNLKVQVSGTTSVFVLLAIYAGFISLLWRYSSLRTYLIALCFITAAFCSKNALIMYFPWYCAWWTPIPPLVWAALVHRTGEFKWNSKVKKSVQAIAIVASLAALPFAYTQVEVGKRWTLPIQLFYWDKVSDRLRVYEKAGDYLNNVAPNAKLVGIGELGIIGTVYKGKMFDLQGMVTPEALTLYPVPESQRTPTCVFSLPTEFPKRYKPDWMLFLDSFARKGLLDDKYFNDNYRCEMFWKNGTFDSTGVYLYKRKEQ